MITVDTDTDYILSSKIPNSVTIPRDVIDCIGNSVPQFLKYVFETTGRQSVRICAVLVYPCPKVELRGKWHGIGKCLF